MISETLDQISLILEKAFPDLLYSLNDGAPLEQLQNAGMQFGQPLPDELKNLYVWHNGESAGYGLFFGLPFLSLEDALHEWKAQTELSPSTELLDTNIFSFPEGHIKENYSNRNYFPLCKDYAGNYIGVDLDPADLGTSGQVINFGRDEELRYVIATSISGFLNFILAQLQQDNFVIWEEDESKYLLLKDPENFNFLDALKSLTLPYSGVSKPAASPEDLRAFQLWFETLDKPWKNLFQDEMPEIDTFQSLSQEHFLRLIDSNFRDLSPLEKFTGVRYLVIGSTAVKDFSPIGKMEALRRVTLSEIQDADLSFLNQIKKLNDISIRNSSLDLKSNPGLDKLKFLSLDNSPLASFDEFKFLPVLRSFSVKTNKFRSFKAFEYMRSLIFLDLDETNCEDISFIGQMPHLLTLGFYNTRLKDLLPIVNHPTLEEVSCSYADFLRLKEISMPKINIVIKGGMTEEQTDNWIEWMQG